MQHIYETPQFQTDYLISWDFNPPDRPCIHIVKLEREGTQVIATIIGSLYELSGCVSLRQVIDNHEYQERENAKESEKELERFEQILKDKEGDKL